MAVQSQDIASLFKELEDASKLAKLEEKNNKETTKKQVKELDSFLTSVQKVVKVIEKKENFINAEIKLFKIFVTALK